MTHDVRDTPRDEPDDGFLFVGHALALDLVNTEVVVRGRPGDLLSNPIDTLRWWQAVQRHHALPLVASADNSDATTDVVATHAALTTLRSALRRIFSQIADAELPDADMLTTLNTVLRQGVPAAHVDVDGRIQPVYQVAASPVHSLVFTVAFTALQLLTASDLHRLHRCGNERCVLLFYDTTKSATRRWCSLGCMDRARSIRRYHEAKHGTQE